jgi:hypothetical protein
METKHTPAPWEYDGCEYVTRETFDIICALPNADASIDEDTIEANARLIAAAPDLLKAAEFAVKAIESDRWHVMAIDKLRAAIAKATGEGKK